MSETISINSLYDALQNFRSYVENNMPYKGTTFFGVDDPTINSGFHANLGTTYVQTNPEKTEIINLFYKATNLTTGWVLFGSGNSSNVLRNFIFLDISNYSNNKYSASVNDYLIIGINPSVPFEITLPNTTEIGSKLYFDFNETSINYQSNYTLKTLTTPFFQTVENAITVTNGGFYLECELVKISNTYYWYLSYFTTTP